jgi:hypothetical protein
LRATLLAADIVTPHDLGVWCRHMQGVPVGGLCIERVSDGREGAQWAVVMR